VTDPLALKNQQIASLQQEIAALKIARATGPGSAHAQQLLAQAKLQAMQSGFPAGAFIPPTFVAPPLPTMPDHIPAVTDVPFVETPAAVAEVVAEFTPAEDAAFEAALEDTGPLFASMPTEAMAPVESCLTPATEAPETCDDVPHLETAMTAETPKPTEARTFMPDVKMLAPLLKIALSALTIEQMVEVGLHVKQGAPGFREFLDSEVAKEKFKELYGTYCDFLAGRVK
jgi:hypothetical protein